MQNQIKTMMFHDGWLAFVLTGLIAVGLMVAGQDLGQALEPSYPILDLISQR